MSLYATFDPASPGAIGGTTPAAITGTTLTINTAALLPEANDVPYLRGITSTGAGIATKFDRLYLFAGGSYWVQLTSTELTLFTPLIAGAISVGVSGVSFAPKVGGAIFDHFIDGASVSVDGTEDTLYTDTLAAGALNANGAKIQGYYQIAVVGHAVSTDRIRLYFGGTVIFDTAAINFPLTSAMTLMVRIIRVSASVVRCLVSATTTTATVVPYSQYTEVTGLTLSNTQIIKLTDISTGTNSAAGDVTAKLAALYWEPAA